MQLARFGADDRLQPENRYSTGFRMPSGAGRDLSNDFEGAECDDGDMEVAIAIFHCLVARVLDIFNTLIPIYCFTYFSEGVALAFRSTGILVSRTKLIKCLQRLEPLSISPQSTSHPIWMIAIVLPLKKWWKTSAQHAFPQVSSKSQATTSLLRFKSLYLTQQQDSSPSLLTSKWESEPIKTPGSKATMSWLHNHTRRMSCLI